VRARAGFHADQAGFQLAKKVEHRPASQLFLQDNRPIRIHPVKLENGLGEIDPECCNLHVVDSFLSWLSHCTSMAQRDAVGVEPSTPSD
jgi:hypothetical protein